MKVLITDGLHRRAKTYLQDGGYKITDLTETGNQKYGQENLSDLLDGYAALIVRSATKVTRDVIEKAKGLKVIGRAGIGVDNIDVKAAHEKGIKVMNAPDGNTNAVAELVFGMIFSMTRHIHKADYQLRRGVWEKKAYEGVEISGKTMGVIGHGRIGTRVEKIARGFDMFVYNYDVKNPHIGYFDKPLEVVLEQSDFVSMHTPKIDVPLISRAEFRRMKPTAYLINTSRGGNVDEEALYEALKEGIIAGAALDVFEREGKEGQPYLNKLFELPNFFGLPHLGASTKEAQEKTAMQIANSINSYLKYGHTTNTIY